MAVQRDIKKVEIPIFKSQISVSPENTIPIQFRIKTEDGTQISTWSNVYEIAGPAVISDNVLTMANKAGANKKVLLSWDDENNANLYDVFVNRVPNIAIRAAAPGSVVLSKTSTVATASLYYSKDGTGTRLEHGLKVGMTITVANTLPQFDRVGTTVTEIVDPYTFKYSPVGNTDTTGTTQADFDIFVTAVPSPTLSIGEYAYVDSTNRTSYNLSKSFNLKTSISGTELTVAASHMYAIVQVASSNKKPNSLLTIGYANANTL